MIHEPEEEIKPIYEQKVREVVEIKSDPVIQEVIDKIEKEPPKKTVKEKLLMFWNKTVFPGMIKARKEKAAWKRELKKEVEQEVQVKKREVLKEQMVNAELAKLKGTARPWSQKLAEGFSNNSNGKTNKFVEALGGSGNGPSFDVNKILGNTQPQPQERRRKKKKRRQQSVQQEPKKGPFDYNEKIGRMLK